MSALPELILWAMWGSLLAYVAIVVLGKALLHIEKPRRATAWAMAMHAFVFLFWLLLPFCT